MGLYADRRFRGSNSYSCFGLFAFLRSFLTTYHLIALQLLQGMTSSRVELSLFDLIWGCDRVAGCRVEFLIFFG